MADIELVIKIPDFFYTQTKSYVEKNKVEGNILSAVAQGKPLPKGHGRLIDADKFISEHFGKVARLVDDAPTIIEADKGDKE